MMKKWILFLLWAMPLCSFAKTPEKAIYELIDRITPGYARQFRLEIIEPEQGNDVYEIDRKGNKVVLRGNNAVALATAYHWYLKYTCNAHVSWFGDQLQLPKRLPLPEARERRVIQGKYRVYFNYCTISYTAPWWNWERWQRELDFMAMNSINMPLSVIGLEGVWYNALLRYGFTDEEARTFLTGPGHAAWQWMQNIQSYGGPLPKSWIDSHVVLGQKIMERQLELGMQPIQQGFSGYVPREFKSKFPEARIKLQPSWCAFQGAAQLEPTDPLFQEFGKAFLEEEKKLFGAHGVYAADPFHESTPPVNTKEYLNAVGKSIYQLFRDFDPEAKWAMQAWSLREDIVKMVPPSDMIILDLNGVRSAKANACWGYPVVAGNLHNFGGRVNLHGDLRLLASNQYAVARKGSPNICGSGLFMESIIQNPVYYDLAFEMPNHPEAVEIENWLKKYAMRRYGAKSEAAEKAWSYLLEGPYRPGTNGTERSSIVAARPALHVKKSGPNAGLGIPYSPVLLLKAEALLLKDSAGLKHSKPYRFDIVDVQRQLMSNLGQAIHRRAAGAFRQNDKAAFELHSGRFLELLKDMDELLRTREEFNFDKWLSDARSWGQTEEEKAIFEKDATALVTIWGGDGDPLIFDYSWREWCGLISGYYAVRWQKFYDMLRQSLDKGTGYSEKGLKLTHGREAFRANAFYSELGDWELSFVEKSHVLHEPVVQGDEVEVAGRMFRKYSELAKEYYAPEMDADQIKEGETYENLGI